MSPIPHMSALGSCLIVRMFAPAHFADLSTSLMTSNGRDAYVDGRYLQLMLSTLREQHIRKLKAGKLLLPDSHLLVILPDFTRTLAAGAIAVFVRISSRPIDFADAEQLFPVLHVLILTLGDGSCVRTSNSSSIRATDLCPMLGHGCL